MTTIADTVRRCAEIVETEAQRLASWQQDLFGPPSYEPPATTHEMAEVARRLCASQVEKDPMWCPTCRCYRGGCCA